MTDATEPIKYCEIQLQIPPAATEAVTHLLHQAGTGGVVIDDEAKAELRAYLPQDERLPGRLEALRRDLTDLVAFFPGMREFRQVQRTVVPEDWAATWRDHYHAVRIGRRLVVAPSWEVAALEAGTAVAPPAGFSASEVILRLDPGMAFGTGTHPSTVLCLRALEDLSLAGRPVIDVGTGSGILAIAAALFGAAQVTACDIDPLAVRVARNNAATNAVADRVTVRYAELADLLREGCPPAFVVLANLTADLLVRLMPDLAAATASEGTLVVSGIIGAAEAEVQEAIGRAGLRPLRTARLEDWVCIAAVATPR